MSGHDSGCHLDLDHGIIFALGGVERALTLDLIPRIAGTEATDNDVTVQVTRLR